MLHHLSTSHRALHLDSGFPEEKSEGTERVAQPAMNRMFWPSTNGERGGPLLKTQTKTNIYTHLRRVLRRA